MHSTSSSKDTNYGLYAESLLTDGASKRRRRQAKRQKRLAETRHMLFTKNFSNYRLPVPVPVPVTTTNPNIVQLSRYESKIERARHPPLLVLPDQKSKWAKLRMIACPCHSCSCTLDPNAWLAHYLNDHKSRLEVPFVEVPHPIEKQTLRASCNVASLDYDVNNLIGVFGYQRYGYNPLNSPRNTLLPKEYRQYSRHSVLLLFACRTHHSLLWQRKQMDDVLVIWASTPMQGVSIALRCVVQPSQSTRYYAKCLKAHSLPTSAVQPLSCSESIKTDCNVVLMSYQDLCQEQQLLNVELHVTGEQKI